MKKKYEKPEMIVEVMSVDLLQMKCINKSAILHRSATASACSCCTSHAYPTGSSTV